MKFKILKIFFLALIFFFLTASNTHAQEQKQIVLVNPIRGSDFWTHNYSLIQTPKNQYSTTWLIRYDALLNREVQEFLKTLDTSQDIGIFFEITPTFANAAQVKYNDTGNWHFAKSVLLTGYSPEDRTKLIDTAFKKFKEVTGK